MFPRVCYVFVEYRKAACLLPLKEGVVHEASRGDTHAATDVDFLSFNILTGFRTMYMKKILKLREKEEKSFDHESIDLDFYDYLV